MHSDFTILMLCTGNICRSPLAQQLLSEQLSDIPDVRVVSAGTRAMVGEKVFGVTRLVADSYGLEGIDSHRARQVTAELIDSADLILAMTLEHRRAAVELCPRATRRTFTLREFARLVEATPDPVLAPLLVDPGDSVAEKLRAAVSAVTSSRSLLPPLADPADNDVIDPYRQDLEVHEASLDQLVPAIDTVLGLIRRIGREQDAPGERS